MQNLGPIYKTKNVGGIPNCRVQLADCRHMKYIVIASRIMLLIYEGIL
jgi:hypothetical protein